MFHKINMSKNTWEQFYIKRGRFYLESHEYIDKVIARFKSYNINLVLDLGCGSGRHSIKLAQNDFKVIGLDFSKTAIELAKKWADRENLKVKFLVGNFQKKLPFKKNIFSAIITIDTLHYETVDDLKFTLKECNRILRTGGIIFVTLPTQIGNPFVTHLIFTEDEIKDIISKDFKILETMFDSKRFLCVFAIKNN